MKNLPNKNLWRQRDEYISSISTLFDDFFNSQFPENFFSVGLTKGAFPKVDIIDFDDSIQIVSELAGWTKEDLDVTIKDSVLTISGKNNLAEAEGHKGTYIVRELKRSSFQRSFTLGEELDQSSLDGSFSDGILKITIKKNEPKTPTEIKVDLK